MARPIKEGMDYFPHDTDAVNDEKVEALRTLYGNDGYAFYFILLERIYRTKDFELNISDAEIIQILCRKISVNEEKFNNMLGTSLKWGCFDQQSYEERGVLTSNGIKKRASIVLEKRIAMRKKYQQDKEEISDAETTQETQPETPQSKVKKSKEKDSKDKDIYSVFQYWNSKQITVHRELTQAKKSKINARLQKGYTVEQIMQAIDNYNTVLKSDKHYWTHKWGLEQFLKPENLDKFIPENKPLENYLKNEFKGNQTMPKAFQSMKEWLEEGEDEQTRDRPIDVDSYS